MDSFTLKLKELFPDSKINCRTNYHSKLFSVGEFISFNLENNVIEIFYIERTDKYSGTYCLAKIEELVRSNEFIYKISLIDNSKITTSKYKIYLAPLLIMTKGRTWYNKNGYFQDNYEVQKKQWNTILLNSLGYIFDNYFDYFTDSELLFLVESDDYFDSFINILYDIDYDFKGKITKDNAIRILKEFIDKSRIFFNCSDIDIYNTKVNYIGKFINKQVKEQTCSFDLIVVYYLISFVFKYNCLLNKYI